MANRFPLVVDTSDSNKIKEIPVGDNLNLSGVGIVNAASIQTDGTLTANNVIVNGQQISAVALSGNYEDLNGAPTGFSGSYNDLVNKPSIPSTTRTLNDVQDVEPADGNVLQWSSVAGRYEPAAVDLSFNLGRYSLGDIGNVIVSGDTTNKWLKYYSGAWRPANILYSDVSSAPTKLSDLINDLTVSDFSNDAGYISSETDSQLLSFDGTNLSISNGNSINIAEMNLTGTVTGDVTGSVFSDGSTLLVDGVRGKIVGDSEGNLFARDGVTLLVDTSAGTIVGPINSNSITVSSLTLGEGGTITGGAGGIGLGVSEGGSLDISVTDNQIIISNDPGSLQAQSGVSIKAGNALVMSSQGTLALRAGPDGGPYTNMDVYAGAFSATTGSVNWNCNGFTVTSSSNQIVLSGPEVSVNSTMIFEDNTTLKIPVYADASARNAAQPDPYEGSMVWVSDISKLQIWNGSSWANMN